MTASQFVGEFNALREEVDRLVQRRLIELMKEMVQNQRLTPNAVDEFQAINAMWTLLGLEWTGEDDLK